MLARVPQKVPHGAHYAWGRAQARQWEAIADAAERGQGQGVAAAVEGCFALTQYLADPRGRRGAAGRLNERLRRLEDGEPVTLAGEGERQPARAPAPRRQPVESPPQLEAKRKAQAIHRHLANGDVSKAAAVLDRKPLLAYSAVLAGQLQALHPDEAAPALPEAAGAAAQVSAELLAQVVRRLKPGKSAGPSGGTYEHVQAAFHASADARAALLRLVNAMLAGQLPRDTALLDCRLIAVHKPDGGARPIAIGEVLVRIAGVCVLAANPELARDLAPLQQGVGVPGGAENVGHALRAGIAADPGCVTLKLDFRNAFGTLQRASMLQTVAERAAPVLPWASWLYGQHTRLWLQGAPAGAQPILSRSGLRQGCPTSPLLFGLATHAVLADTAAAVPAARIIADHDDVLVQGPAAAVVRAHRELRDRAAPLGLREQPSKGVAWSADASAAARVSAETGVRDATCADAGDAMLLAAGTPIGDERAVRAWSAGQLLGVMDRAQALHELPVSLQDEFALLRASLSQQAAHLLRILPPHARAAEGQAALATVLTVQAASAVGASPQSPRRDEDRRRLRAPIRHGGFAITSHSDPHLARAAFLSAAAQAQRALRGGPPEFSPFNGPLRGELAAHWDAVRAAAPELWPEQAALDDAFIEGDLAGVQRRFRRHQADAAHAAALERCATPAVRAKLLSQACKAAGAWKVTLPTCPAHTFADRDFRAAVRRHLDLSAMPPTIRPVSCSCGATVPPGDPDHMLKCATVQGLRIYRHDMAVHRLLAGLARAGLGSVREPHVQALGGGARPAPGPAAALHARRASRAHSPEDGRGDLWCCLDGEHVMVDVAVVHPTTFLAQAARTAGGAAQAKEKEKERHYAGQPAATAYSFVPFVVETHGRLGKQAMDFLDRLGEHAALRADGAFTKASFVEGLLKDVSAELVRWNGHLERAAASACGAAGAGRGQRHGFAQVTADPGAAAE